MQSYFEDSKKGSARQEIFRIAKEGGTPTATISGKGGFKFINAVNQDGTKAFTNPLTEFENPIFAVVSSENGMLRYQLGEVTGVPAEELAELEDSLVERNSKLEQDKVTEGQIVMMVKTPTGKYAPFPLSTKYLTDSDIEYTLKFMAEGKAREAMEIAGFSGDPYNWNSYAKDRNGNAKKSFLYYVEAGNFYVFHSDSAGQLVSINPEELTKMLNGEGFRFSFVEGPSKEADELNDNFITTSERGDYSSVASKLKEDLTNLLQRKKYQVSKESINNKTSRRVNPITGESQDYRTYLFDGGIVLTDARNNNGGPFHGAQLKFGTIQTEGKPAPKEETDTTILSGPEQDASGKFERTTGKRKGKKRPSKPTQQTSDPITEEEVTAMPLVRTFFADRIARIKEVIDGKRKAGYAGSVGNEIAVPMDDKFGEKDSKGRVIDAGGSHVYLTQEEKNKIALIKAQRKAKKLNGVESEAAIQEVLRGAFKRALATYEVVEDAPILEVKERVEAFKAKQSTQQTSEVETNKAEIAKIKAERKAELDKIIDYINIEEHRRPNGSMGTQGFTPENMMNVISFINDNLNLNIPSNLFKEGGLRELLDYIKADSSLVNSIENYVKTDPAEINILPDDSIHIQDGNHRANLLNLIGAENIPSVTTENVNKLKEINAEYDAKIAALESQPQAGKIVSAEFTQQATNFELEIQGENKPFLLVWNRNRPMPSLFGNKKEDGSYTTTDSFPSKQDIQKLIDKYVPKNLLNLLNEWTKASKLPASEVLDAQEKIENKIKAELKQPSQDAPKIVSLPKRDVPADVLSEMRQKVGGQMDIQFPPDVIPDVNKITQDQIEDLEKAGQTKNKECK